SKCSGFAIENSRARNQRKIASTRVFKREPLQLIMSFTYLTNANSPLRRSAGVSAAHGGCDVYQEPLECPKERGVSI
ncbi:hypothetical protein Pgy4_35913, partial [Pseudomonas savastanoi pv. glycinea str. race 4]